MPAPSSAGDAERRSAPRGAEPSTQEMRSIRDRRSEQAGPRTGERPRRPDTRDNPTTTFRRPAEGGGRLSGGPAPGPRPAADGGPAGPSRPPNAGRRPGAGIRPSPRDAAPPVDDDRPMPPPPPGAAGGPPDPSGPKGIGDDATRPFLSEDAPDPVLIGSGRRSAGARPSPADDDRTAANPSPFGRADAPPPPPGPSARGPKARPAGPSKGPGGPGDGPPPSPSAGPGGRPRRPGSGQHRALGGESRGGVDTATRPDSGSTGWFDALDPLSEIDGEPTPALLAAKAEPLTRPRSSRPSRRPQRSSRPGARPGQKPAGPQARRGGRRKPKEPSKALLVLGVIVVLASGLGAAYLFTRSSGDEQAADLTSPTSTPDDPAATSSGDGEQPADPATTDSTAPEAPATGQAPAISFDEAAMGPITAGQPYTIEVLYGPADAQYQLSVDGTAQGEPAPQLAPVTFEPGRHLLEISLITASGSEPLVPALVYAVGDLPTAPTWVANLSSVSISDPTEGWAEAVNRFENFSATHQNLKLLPPDALPGLPPDYWVIFVDGGFATKADVIAYCEQKQLAVPDQCFARELQPSGG